MNISETLNVLRQEEASLVAKIGSLNSESVKLKLKAAGGDASAVTRRGEILIELQAATQDLSDTRAAIQQATPMLRVERLEEAADTARDLTKRVSASLDERVPLAAKVDGLVTELAATLRALERRYTEAQHATMRAMNPQEAMAIGWDHEQVAQGVIGNLLRLAGWDESVLASLSSHGLSLLRQVEPIAEIVAHQGAQLLAIRQREEEKLADALDRVKAPAEEEA